MGEMFNPQGQIFKALARSGALTSGDRAAGLRLAGEDNPPPPASPHGFRRETVIPGPPATPLQAEPTEATPRPARGRNTILDDEDDTDRLGG